MRVNNSSPSVHSSDSAEVSSTKKSGQTAKAYAKGDKAGASPAAAGANGGAEISAKAKDMAKAKSAAGQAPDVREERVAELKRKISAGDYHVDSAAIADRMVDEHLASI